MLFFAGGIELSLVWGYRSVPSHYSNCRAADPGRTYARAAGSKQRSRAGPARTPAVAACDNRRRGRDRRSRRPDRPPPPTSAKLGGGSANQIVAGGQIRSSTPATARSPKGITRRVPTATQQRSCRTRDGHGPDLGRETSRDRSPDTSPGNATRLRRRRSPDRHHGRRERIADPTHRRKRGSRRAVQDRRVA